MRFEANLTTESGSHPSTLPLLMPVSAAYYTSYLLLPMYWTHHDLDKYALLSTIPATHVLYSPGITLISFCTAFVIYGIQYHNLRAVFLATGR